jgi:SAM-dependent methyltransferase
LPHRDELLKQLPPGGVVAEVGTYQGHFARKILDVCQPDRLHAIDIDLGAFAYRDFGSELSSERLVLHQGDSSTILSGFSDGYFDWMYIDADHSYEGVYKDIQQAKRVVRPDGLLVFNDYTVYSWVGGGVYGIPRAVHDLCLDEGWEFTYFALNSAGYHDVALRRVRRAWSCC